MNLKHKLALNKAIDNVKQGRSMRTPVTFELLIKWRTNQQIPLIHVGEVARLADLLPSEVDEHWKGKDLLFINWE